MRRLGALLLLLLTSVAPLSPEPMAAPTPESKPTTEVFTGGGEARSAADRPTTATTAYWRIKAYVKVPEAAPGSRVEMLLPLSDSRQQIVRREERGNGFTFREVGDALNLRGIWVRTGTGGAADVEYEVTAEISDAEVNLPSKPSSRMTVSKRSLEPSELIQSDDPEIRRRAKEITAGTGTADAAAWALFQFTSSAIEAVPGEARTDAKGVLADMRGNSTGKARLLAALLRSLGVPARVVGGLRLEDASKKRATISWVEAQLEDEWVPLDPGGNHFGWLPHDYLALYRGDLPLLVHTAGVDVEYGFIVRQVTREAALGVTVASGAAEPKIETQVGTEQVKTVTSYQDKPVASALVIVDSEIPETVRGRMLKEAQDDEVNLVILHAASQSRYFREQQLQRLVSNNLSLVSGAHLVLIATSDDAGLYALFALGERGVKLGDARVVIGGSYPAPVGNVLGAVLLRLIDAGEVVLVNRPTPLLALWEIARANLLRGVPMVEESRKWDVEPLIVTPTTERGMTRWRQLVIGAWTRAVRAQVPLQALNLILILPVIATIIVVARVLIGVESFGTFAPVIVSLAFVTTGLQWGVIIFTVIVTFGALVRTSLQRLRLQLVSRLAILIATVAGAMAGLTVLGASLGIGPLINISIFPMVIMSSVIENFAASQFELGTREAVRLTVNTLFLACLCYLAIARAGLQSVVLAFPEIIAGAILLNILLGKFRGLRLLEYLRFGVLGRGAER